jgi:cytochrome c-type biogenesis protein
MGAHFANIASTGPFALAVLVAALAGLVSFLSPCILPLVPGYLSYVTGLAGADLDAALGTDPHGRPVPPPAPEPAGGGVAVAARPQVLTRGQVRGRVVGGAALFVAGFTAVFVCTGVLAAQAGHALLRHERTIELVMGVVIVLLGLSFAGVIPGLSREYRIGWLPKVGIAGAPLLGAVFALSWMPCTGPTLTAVLTLSSTMGNTTRAVGLVIAYCAGLGLPFLIFALGFRRVLGLFAGIRRHSRWVSRIGGALLVIVGLALITGGWTDFINWLRSVAPVGSVSL